MASGISVLVFVAIVYLWSDCYSLADVTNVNNKRLCGAGQPRNGTEYFQENTAFGHCQHKHFNKTNCTVCQDREREPYICYTNNTNVDQVLQDIPSDISYLILVINNKWEGHLPFTVGPINLTRINRMTKLQWLEIRQFDFSYGQLYPLVFNKHSFKPLTLLKKLSIQIPLQDQDLGDMVAPLSLLELFDISFTRGWSLHNLTKTLGRINKGSIRYLCLRTFQLIGGDGYSFNLSMKRLTGDMTESFLNLEEIDLSDNSLARIEPGIYDLAPKLKILDVSGNVLLDSHNVPVILEGLLHPTLVEFNAGYQGYIGGTHPINNNIRPHISTTQFRRSIDQLKPQTIDYTGGFRHHFDFQNAFIMHCINLVSSNNISMGFHSNTIICDFLECVAPIQFGGLPCNLIPKLNETYDFDCFLYTRIPLGPNLKIYLFGHVHWEESSTTGLALRDQVCFTNNSLETIVFDSNSKWLKAGKIDYTLNHLKSVKGLENIKTFSLDKNYLDVTLDFLTTANNMQNMVKLDLSFNNVRIQESLTLCSHMPKLGDLNLSANNISVLPTNMIINCSNLKTINLSKNNLDEDALTTWDLNGTDKIEMIDLSGNYLQIINSTFQQKLHLLLSNRTEHLYLNLLDNPLSCGCDAIDFVKWIRNDHSQLKFVEFEKYTCSGQKGLQFLWRVNVHDLVKICDDSDLVPILIGVCSSVGVLLLTLTVFGIYSMRWRLKYYLHQVKQKLKRSCCCNCTETTSEGPYTYDAFVSYCAEDRFWVHEVLMKTLESTYGFRLCIHYRDFPVGGSIYHTIADCMDDSKTIILVVSDVSVASRMCQFEIDEAQKQAVDKRKQILLIKLGEISRPLPDPSYAFLLDRHTYLEWSDDQKAHKLFWAKLVGHLYDDFQGSSNFFCCCPYGTRSLGYEEI